MREVWFIRHGESKANAGDRTIDTSSIELTENGQNQALDVMKIFSAPESWQKNYPQPNLIVTSPYIRTKQTAEPTVNFCKTSRVQEWPVQEFTYLSNEKWKDSTRDEREPARKQYWENLDPDYRDGDGAESFRDLMVRVKNTVGGILTLPEDFIVVFSHGQFMKTLWWYLMQFLVDDNLLLSEVKRAPWELYTADRVDSETMNKVHNFFNSVAIPNTGILKINFSEGLAPLIKFDNAHLKIKSY